MHALWGAQVFALLPCLIILVQVCLGQICLMLLSSSCQARYLVHIRHFFSNHSDCKLLLRAGRFSKFHLRRAFLFFIDSVLFNNL
ncbi:unnamed protein product [Moneuplotes crassus]|uniref:Secreted protein n=1 Tax=Euplotes crassus TaxID=5936 RepID=A0AAD1XDY4_EUPCR|nr:unnamed protein product [Moneuplotes crassus]